MTQVQEASQGSAQLQGSHGRFEPLSVLGSLWPLLILHSCQPSCLKEALRRSCLLLELQEREDLAFAKLP